ncbi:MAG: hypothetical protein ACM3UU_07065 [Ignavibacteriales bacterium]
MQSVKKGKRILFSTMVGTLLMDIVSIIFVSLLISKTVNNITPVSVNNLNTGSELSRTVSLLGMLSSIDFTIMIWEIIKIGFILKLIFDAVIFYFLYEEKKWAKWFEAILSLVCGILLLLITFELGISILLPVGIFYISIGFVLIASRSVSDFLSYQRLKDIKIEDITIEYPMEEGH